MLTTEIQGSELLSLPEYLKKKTHANTNRERENIPKMQQQRSSCRGDDENKVNDRQKPDL